MEKESYKLVSYAITDDPGFMDEQNAVTPELRDKLDALYVEVMEEKGSKRIIKKLLGLIEEFPQNPQLKNYLFVTYMNSGNTAKAREANRWIQAEHPDYLFGKLNEAAEYFENGEFEKMAEVLGPEMELQSLYPARDKFHIAELTGFYKIAILYFVSTGNLKAAQERLEIMQEIAPNHPDTEFAEKEMMRANLAEGIAFWDENSKTSISVTHAPDTLPEQISEPPEFAHEIINRLYEEGLYIQHELLQEILKLPRESLIADLELILKDMLCRFEYFWDKVGEELMEFPIHAFMLLGELRSTESLPKLLEVLRQDEDFLDFWFGDHLTETLWEPLYYLGNQQLNVLKNFVEEPGVYCYAKTAVSTAVAQIYYHQPERSGEVMQWFSQLLDFFIDSQLEDNVIDSETISLLVCDIAELNFTELMPQIKKLYDKKYVSKGVAGDFEEIEEEMAEATILPDEKELMNIENRYKQITTSWGGYTEEDEFEAEDGDFGLSDYEDLTPTEPIRTAPKIGRNEPCPCGSGKKYKKCCMNKSL